MCGYGIRRNRVGAWTIAATQPASRANRRLRSEMMADAARRNVDAGAQIIDINMGCPAKKVCNKLAGSALLQDEALVARILRAVVSSVTVPVTLKTRTGWDLSHKNGVHIAQIAEGCGIQALAIHGRTRADMYQGIAEHETARTIKAQDFDSGVRERRH